jgi:hypothetical protein
MSTFFQYRKRLKANKKNEARRVQRAAANLAKAKAIVEAAKK